MQRESYHHGNLRSSLINKAEELIESGNTDISLRQLARMLGVSHTAPYRHFKSWNDLQTHIKDSFIQQMYEDLTRITRGERASEIKIRDYARKLIEISIIKPQKFRFLSLQAEMPESQTSGSNEQLFRLLMKLCVQYLHEQDCRKNSDPFIIASSLWCSFFGIAHLIHAGWIPFDKKSVYGEKLLNACLQSILPRA